MDKKQFLTELGNRIVQLRLDRGWSQADLARACFKDRQSIERLENGKINPSIYYLKEIADALEVPPNKLLEF
ncbi:helix-turn-helix domain-containing protein [Larkinella bovis]|uniref:Helix-turn-helix domain-containing protein n=1 Tax=Larkinella bovis TaxID=683041 RepID=A0ABW0IDX5_9BACT